MRGSFSIERLSAPSGTARSPHGRDRGAARQSSGMSWTAAHRLRAPDGQLEAVIGEVPGSIWAVGDKLETEHHMLVVGLSVSRSGWTERNSD
jgi:hypothetical protein